MVTIKSLTIHWRKGIFSLVVFLSIGYPLIVSLKSLAEGSIPFWYDPARDFLLAVDNLKKPSLIGPPSGIPGIFYGPYWIWLISLGLLLSRDPRITATLILAIPYFTIFPYILFRFSPVFSRKICLLGPNVAKAHISARYDYVTEISNCTPKKQPSVGVFAGDSCDNNKLCRWRKGSLSPRLVPSGAKIL